MLSPKTPRIRRFVDCEFDLGSQVELRLNGLPAVRQIMSAPDASPQRAEWTECVPHDPMVAIEDGEFFHSRMMLLERDAQGGERMSCVPYDRPADRVSFTLPKVCVCVRVCAWVFIIIWFPLES